MVGILASSKMEFRNGGKAGNVDVDRRAAARRQWPIADDRTVIEAVHPPEMPRRGDVNCAPALCQSPKHCLGSRLPSRKGSNIGSRTALLRSNRLSSRRNHIHEFLAAPGYGGSLWRRRLAGTTRWPIATAASASAFWDDSSATTDHPVFWPSSHCGHDKSVVQKISTTKLHAAKANIHGARRFNLAAARWLTRQIVYAAFTAGRGSTASMGCDGLAVADIGPDMNDTAAWPSVAAVHGLKAVVDPGPPRITLGVACPPVPFIRYGSTEAGSVDGHLF
ncbi:hypothetical protein [Sediminicoccus sp. KRV36]|uniref:hypothetical protein n=1 Tax=Sediminicoccus sp. KRV36 TaxID=3133721 RepID=UPI00200F081B|nr:hypothetical protein [Sediminicoccus rosea]UPY37240.1 hypothetical protein LHU95_00690 [Sediminicoccus rosea]